MMDIPPKRRIIFSFAIVVKPNGKELKNEYHIEANPIYIVIPLNKLEKIVLKRLKGSVRFCLPMCQIAKKMIIAMITENIKSNIIILISQTYYKSNYAAYNCTVGTIK